MYICSMKLTFGMHSLSFSEEEIPKVSVPKTSILQHGDDITIVCIVCISYIHFICINYVSTSNCGGMHS